MNGYDDDDPVDHIVSGTPENVFRRCPFAGERKSGDSDSDSSDSEAFRVESTGIFMLSLPDSLEEKDDCTPHLYQTAPEEFAPTGSDGRRSVPADAIGAEVSAEYVDDGKAVDLGRDTDVGLYSEVQSTTETGEKDKSIEIISVCRSHSSEAKKSGLPFDESVVSLGESSSKKLRLSEETLGSSSCARTVVDKFPVDSIGGGSKLVTASSLGHNNGDEDSSGGKCNLKGMDGGKVSDDENGEIHCNCIEKSAEKEVKESVKNSRGMDDGKVSNGEILCNYKEKSAGKEVKESVKNSQSHQQSKLQEEIANGHQSSSRVLPPSISGVKKTAAVKNSNTSEDHPMEVTLLEILKILKGEQESEIEIDDDSLSKLSILDIVQQRGMTFPRPEWWPPEA